MNAIFKLKNQVKHYNWGSPQWIPRLLGAENAAGEPWAELWMGVHPGAPSQVVLNDGSRCTEITLGGLIAQNPRQYLGKEVSSRVLPFLFKLLAAAKPLSIQAHPSLEQARMGWRRENERHIPLDSPNRNYKDENHKPEIICALSPFTAMCGFREPEEIAALLEHFFGAVMDGRRAPRSLQQGLRGLKTALAPPADHRNPTVVPPLKSFLKALFSLSAETRQELTEYILKTDKTDLSKEFDAGACFPSEWENMVRFAELYPGDPGIIAPLYLNLLKLAPGDAVYLDAGVLHAYIDGFGVELMANSDNVLRGGLTPKHVDVDELMGVLDFSPLKPEILKPQRLHSAAADAGFSRYITPCKEFSLGVLRGTGETQGFPPGKPAIIIVTEGAVKVNAGKKEELILNRGESAFIPAEQSGQAPLGLSFEGDYTLYAATLP
ncbi:mannose-6-phosphate isomerase, class I [Spirochaetia bacterium]|nr:mannose-6-phosphate isomerase, class I [Spirochaetia bacterium]